MTTGQTDRTYTSTYVRTDRQLSPPCWQLLGCFFSRQPSEYILSLYSRRFCFSIFSAESCHVGMFRFENKTLYYWEIKKCFLFWKSAVVCEQVLPDRPIHNLRAWKSGQWRFRTAWSLPIHGLWWFESRERVDLVLQYYCPIEKCNLHFAEFELLEIQKRFLSTWHIVRLSM